MATQYFVIKAVFLVQTLTVYSL